MSTRKNSPQIRFVGFEEDWFTYKLKELGKATSGIGFPDCEQGGLEGTPFFKVSDMSTVGNENELRTASNYVTEEQIHKNKWRPITDVPAIFFAKVGAAVMLNRKRLVLHPFLLDNNTMAYSFKKDMWNTLFAKALFDSLNLTTLAQVGALPSFNANDVEQMEVFLPHLTEQTAIGNVYQILEHLITQTKRHYEKIQSLKSAMLEKMFPKDGADVPEVRFAGFTEKWKTISLSDIASEIIRTDKNSKAPIMMITAANGFIEQSKRYAFDNAGQSLEKYTLLKKGELAYNHGASKLRPFGSCFALEADEARIPYVYHCFNIDGYNPYFISRILNNKNTEESLKKLVTSGARMDGLLNISFKEYTSIKIQVPEKGEQNKIDLYFQKHEKLISLYQQKLTKLQSLKKALLERMFV